jgi:hypothetical protein
MSETQAALLEIGRAVAASGLLFVALCFFRMAWLRALNTMEKHS